MKSRCLLMQDSDRLDFAEELMAAAGRGKVILDGIEWQFLQRIVNETCLEIEPLHEGDRNILDSLRRKYEATIKDKK